MADKIRFHLDEHIDPAVARALRRHGADVTTTVEAGLRTKSDVGRVVRGLALIYEVLTPEEIANRVEFL